MNPYQGFEHERQIKIGPFTTSKLELHELLKAWLAISFAFAIVMAGGIFKSNFFVVLVISAITVGIGFLLHELGHKVVAQHYGCFAEFRAFREMLLLAILLSFTGIIFAAPGAVMISGHVNRVAHGKIASAGPLMNVILASFFLLTLFFYHGKIFVPLLLYSIHINALLAVFNLIPFALFDGAKIFAWDKKIWGGMIAMAGTLLVVANML